MARLQLELPAVLAQLMVADVDLRSEQRRLGDALLRAARLDG